MIPAIIQDEKTLIEVMTRPSAALVASMKQISGDLMILGVGGKMGPTLAILAKRAFTEAGVDHSVIGVARFSDSRVQQELQDAGIETIQCDLLDIEQIKKLPNAQYVLYMVGMKFGTTGQAERTWAVNTLLPGQILPRFDHARVVLFSTGNVYPFVPVKDGGCRETDPTGPVGEYAQSALGRERIFAYQSQQHRTPGVIFRLNYAIDLRYGVLLDVAQRVFDQRPIDLSTGHVNVIWQGDANEYALRCLEHTTVPPAVINVTGPETVSIRRLAMMFGDFFQREPVFSGEEAGTALLSSAGKCHRLFGYPKVSLDQMIQWTAHWVEHAKPTLSKPTHYEVRSGKY